MTKKLTEIARKYGATTKINPISGSLVTTFTNDEQLQATFDAMIAQSSEAVAEITHWAIGVTTITSELSKERLKQFPSGTKLFTSPQPSQSAYTKRLEKALEKIANSHTREVICQIAREALASKDKP